RRAAGPRPPPRAAGRRAGSADGRTVRDWRPRGPEAPRRRRRGGSCRPVRPDRLDAPDDSQRVAVGGREGLLVEQSPAVPGTGGGGEVGGDDRDVLRFGGDPPDRDRLFREAAVAERDDERRAGPERPAHLTEDLDRTGQVLDRDGAEGGVEGVVGERQVRVPIEVV